MNDKTDKSIEESMDESLEEEVEVDEQKLESYMNELKFNQNLLGGAFAGLIAAIIGAAIWAAITVITDYQIGYMAIGVGFLVGFAIRFAGKGIDTIFGIVGAGLALLGCLLGNLFTYYYVLSDMTGASFIDMLSVSTFKDIVVLFQETFSPIDLIFYAIAIYCGYQYSFRKISEEELSQFVVQKES